MKLLKFLTKKTLFYDKIDYNIISLSWDILKEHITLPYVIHIVGTNGKGTTGRFLASFLHQKQQKILHYTSPHIIEFNERIWIDGKNSSNTQLDFAHNQLQNILLDDLVEKLTYFEYTTLIALYLSSNMDFIVLEAGLGGEFDATNVVNSDLSIFTTIGLDHQSFLGNSVKEIASTKMRSCKNDFILAKQIYNEVNDIKNNILGDFKEIFINHNLKLLNKANELPIYLQENLLLALSVLEFLDLYSDTLTIDKLPGRFQSISANIIVDVGHNPLAAQALYNELKLTDKKYVLIYNSYNDKDYLKVLTILKPIIKHIEIIECDDDRMVKYDILTNAIKSLSIKFNKFNIKDLNPDNHYFVFGSFLVVENFLKKYNNL